MDIPVALERSLIDIPDSAMARTNGESGLELCIVRLVRLVRLDGFGTRYKFP